jgi:hypothetical protein
MATQAEIDELNVELQPLGTAVREREDGSFELCKLVPTQRIDDIIAYAAIYGVTVAP